jgi:hypothetical protein
MRLIVLFYQGYLTDRPSTLEEAAKGGKYKAPTAEPSVAAAQTKDPKF